MESWLKWLIAVACCVVIAFGANSAWGWYESYQRQKQVQDFQSDCELDVLRLAKFVETQSSYEDEAKAMTKQVRHCASELSGTGFPIFAENTMRTVGYSLDDQVALPSD